MVEVVILRPDKIQEEIKRVDDVVDIGQLIAALKRAAQLNAELKAEIERQRRLLEEKDQMLEIYRVILRDIARMQRKAEVEARRTNPPHINPAPADDSDRIRREGNPPIPPAPEPEPEIEEGKEIRVPGPYYEPDKHSKSKKDRIDRKKARELLGPEMRHIEDFVARPDVQAALDRSAPTGETPEQKKQRAFKAVRNRIQVRGLFQPTDPLLVLMNADKTNFPNDADEKHLQAAYALCWNNKEETARRL